MKLMNSASGKAHGKCVWIEVLTVIQGAAEWTPTFLKVTGKGTIGVGRRGRWQQFGRIF